MSLISLGLSVRKLSGIYIMSRLTISNSSTHVARQYDSVSLLFITDKFVFIGLAAVKFLE